METGILTLKKNVTSAKFNVTWIKDKHYHYFIDAEGRILAEHSMGNVYIRINPKNIAEKLVN